MIPFGSASQANTTAITMAYYAATVPAHVTATNATIRYANLSYHAVSQQHVQPAAA